MPWTVCKFAPAYDGTKYLFCDWLMRMEMLLMVGLRYPGAWFL